MAAPVPKPVANIANPSYATVALACESGKMQVPVCVAKGVDPIALKIRDFGKQSAIPMVENPPLACARYAPVDVDENIKPGHGGAMAQVIGFVMRSRGKVASARTERRSTERRI